MIYAKNVEMSLGSIKEYYQQLKENLLYEHMVSFVEKYAFDKQFKNDVLTEMSLCRKNGIYKIDGERFEGQYSDMDGVHEFILNIKFPVIAFEIRENNKSYQGNLTFSSKGTSYVCYKQEEVRSYSNSKGDKSTLDYDIYDIEIERVVFAFNNLKIQIGNYKQIIRENFIINKETGDKCLKDPSTFENYVESVFSCRRGDNFFIRGIKKYNHPNPELAFIPLKDEDTYLRSTVDEDLYWGISKEKAEELDFPSDEEIKKYQKLMIS